MPIKFFYYYAAAIAIFIVLKLAYTQAQTEDLSLLLVPTNYLIELMTGANAVYSPQKGFYYAQLHITIEKSCAGFNFWALSWIMSLFASLKYYEKHLQKIALFPALAAITYLLTLFANASRIIVSIFVKNTFPDVYKAYDDLHQIIGIFIYLSLLIAFYLFINHIQNEKSIKSKVAITR